MISTLLAAIMVLNFDNDFTQKCAHDVSYDIEQLFTEVDVNSGGYFAAWWKSTLFTDTEVNNCFSIHLAKLFSILFWNFYNFMGCRLVSLSSFVYKTFWNTSWGHLSLQNKGNTYFWTLNCQISLLFFGAVRHGDFIDSKRFFRNINITERHLVLLGGELCSIFRDRGTNQIAQKTLSTCEVYAKYQYIFFFGHHRYHDHFVQKVDWVYRLSHT